MTSRKYLITLLTLIIVIISSPSSKAIHIEDPSEITVSALASLAGSDDGAAWISWKGWEQLVTSGYMIGNDLRVVSIAHDAVILYRPRSRQYFSLAPSTPGTPAKDRSDVLWCSALPIWKIVRMIALAYRKDYVCHHSVTAEQAVQGYYRDALNMIRAVVDPHHRFRGRNGVFFIAPVHIAETGWTTFLHGLRSFNDKRIGKILPQLSKKDTLVSDGKTIDWILKKISWKTGVSIEMIEPMNFKVYCSLRDRPWHEILENIVVFNGYRITATRDCLKIGPIK